MRQLKEHLLVISQLNKQGKRGSHLDNIPVLKEGTLTPAEMGQLTKTSMQTCYWLFFGIPGR